MNNGGVTLRILFSDRLSETSLEGKGVGYCTLTKQGRSSAEGALNTMTTISEACNDAQVGENDTERWYAM